MHIFFEIMKWSFFFLTVIVAVFLLRGEFFVWETSFVVAREIIMPGYLIFCGLMFGYIVAHLQGKNQNMTKIYTRSFVIGISVGIILAISYILL